MEPSVVNLENGKYTVILDQRGGEFKFFALRHHEPWRDLVGDNLTFSMFKEITNLREQLEQQITTTGKPIQQISTTDEEQEFHVGYWVSKNMISGVNVNAVDMASAVRKAGEEHNIDPRLIVYAHAKNSVYQKG